MNGLDEILNGRCGCRAARRNGRRYAEMTFDIDAIADRFLEVIARASRRRFDMADDGAGGSAQ